MGAVHFIRHVGPSIPPELLFKLGFVPSQARENTRPRTPTARANLQNTSAQLDNGRRAFVTPLIVRDLTAGQTSVRLGISAWKQILRAVLDADERRVDDCKEDIDTLMVFVSNIFIGSDRVRRTDRRGMGRPASFLRC